MSINNLNTYLNVRDAHLRVVSGNVYAQAMNIGGINVETAHGLQSVSDTGNVTSNTLQFSNATTGFVTTANVQIGRDLVVTGNATVSTDLTVSANATVTDTLTVSEHLLASKEATITGNLHVTTIMSDSNVVAEYTGPHDRPLRKYPEVALTSASQGGYVVTPSTQNATNVAYHMFDGDRSTRWVAQGSTDSYNSSSPYLYNGSNSSSISDTSGTSHDGAFLKLELPKAIKLDYTIIRENSDPASRTPGKITFLGSTNGTDWTFLKEFSGMSNTALDETYIINDTNYYNHFAFVVKNLSDGDGVLDLGEWELYGHEEGSGSLDTTLKSVYNVPATTGTQLEVYYDGRETSSYTGSGMTVTDISPNTNNGTLNGGVGFDTTYKAFTFNGTTTRNITATLPSTVTGEYVHSVSLWVKADEVSRSSGVFTFFTIGSASSANMIALGVNTTSDGIKYDFFNADVRVESPQITSNEWMHFVVTYSGGANNLVGAKRIYLNGKELSVSYGGGSPSSPLSLPTSPTLTLGGQINSGNPPFSGSIANFRLYSKVLSADQIKELYDYQKDYFLGSKSQVTLYKGHLGVGVTEPSGQLELAGDERIQAYPPRGMTHTDGTATGAHTTNVTKNITYIEGHGEFKASASLRSRQDVDYDGHQPYNAFDYTDEDFLIYGPGSQEDVGYNKTTGYYEDNEYRLSASSGTPYGHWLQLEMPYKINVKSYFIQHHHNDYWPQDWQIWASNDDINWTHIHTYTGGTFDTDPQYYTVAHTGHYKIYTMIITRIKEGSTLDRVRIQELRYFGTPGPTTLDKGSLTLGRSLDVPRISRYDVDTETPRPEKLLIDYDTTVNSSLTDISGKGNHGIFFDDAHWSAADKAFEFDGTDDYTKTDITIAGGNMAWTQSMWFKINAFPTTSTNYAVLSFFGSKSSLSGHIMSYKSSEFWQDWYGNGVKANYTFEVGKWYHVVSVYHGNTSTDANVRSSIYINGVIQTLTWYSQTSSQMTLPTSTSYELADYINSANVRHNGWISNPKFYSVALEPSEVRKLYNLGRTGRSMVISDTAVGIGKAPEAQLDVRGNLNVDGVITNQQRPAFYVWRDGTGNNIEAIGHGGQDRLAVTGVITNWDSKRIDTAGTFDLSNGRYYIPVSGLYNFVGAGVYRYQSGNGVLEASFYVNGSLIGPRGISYNRGNTTSEHHTVTITFMRFMNAGDYVQMGVPVAQSACDLYYGDNLGYFSGYLLG